MNHKSHLDIVGPELLRNMEFEYEDVAAGFGRGEHTAITCECIRIVIKQATDDTYSEYCMRVYGNWHSTMSLSAPVYIPSESTLGHARGWFLAHINQLRSPHDKKVPLRDTFRSSCRHAGAT